MGKESKRKPIMPFKVNVADPNAEILASTDGYLFELMKSAERDPEKAKAAWTEFYRRYATYLWNCCLRVCRTMTEGDRVAKDIFQSTMKKIFDQAKTYQPEKGHGIKAWISRIAHNEFIDYFNKYNAKFISFETPPDVVDDSDDDIIDPEFEDKVVALKSDQLKVLLSHLNSKELKVLMTCMNYLQLDKPNSHLPDKVMSELCNEFNIKSDAVRQIKRRALIKLQNIAKNIK